MSQFEQSPITGVKKSYLDDRNFHKNKHSEQVKKIFTGKAANTEYPFPRPVWGNTVDFAIMYKGNHLIDGECKSVDNEGHEVLVFYSTQHLAWKKTTISLLSSPKSMILCKVETRPPDCGWSTVLEKNFWRFTIGAESQRDDIWEVLPKPCYFYMGDSPTLADVHNGAPILHVWDKLHKEQKMYINTMFAVIDVLVAELEDLDFQDIYVRRQVSYDAGFKEPSFWDSYEGETKLRRCIIQQDLYRYGSASFDPTFREKKKLSWEMYYVYKEFWRVARNGGNFQTVTECMEKHEKDTDPDLWK